ncbi:ArsI/CadI family heavy metal resistance metalloenzyme [Alterisphingorhabdus coralli]|uniref:ArsI/CadI family heavy metal resistance metalloenzyme n=1 Tax=Alterisphingorhabdus coralli TaxID=3071408 RepID=A0AA97FAA6_9SPHN|nr:ArsI/CadI family heavy metal resistance metalloenzyme [Parasphingorhabdus sp. SCSIO 66989]WOE75942.1 ArsI/CadI family heavy metal resistance metalloenzyme [Parasphingorhabdus sp. SCSIO 66989]
MKRMHIHLSVDSIEKSVAYYSRLFGSPPTVQKDDYAKWMLENPRVNFAMSSHEGTERGIEHIGIEAENMDELAEVYGRIRDAGGDIYEEGQTTCCYAQSEKNWTRDPDGVIWETFSTTGEVTHYGTRIDAEKIAAESNEQEHCCQA